MNVQKIELMMKLRPVICIKKEAKKVPRIIAKKVREVIIPLAFEIFSV